jgi:hypothetical protein
MSHVTNYSVEYDQEKEVNIVILNTLTFVKGEKQIIFTFLNYFGQVFQSC